MSGRTVPLALAVLLVAALAGPVVAQQTRPEAPMPRVKETHEFGVEVGSGLRTTIPTLGPIGLVLDPAVPLVRNPDDHRQLYNFSVGVFGADAPAVPPMTAPAKPAVALDERNFDLFAEEVVERVPPMTAPAKPDCCEPDCCPGCCRKPAAAVMPQPVPPCLPAAPQAVTGSFVFGGPCPMQPGAAQFLSFQQARDDTAINLHAKPLPTCGIPAPMPPKRVVVLAAGLAERNVLEVCPPCPLPPVAVNPLVGTWYREVPGMVISATFTRDELKMCLTQSADGHTATVTITGHYMLTKDGLVYGAITGADVDVKTGSKTDNAALGMELAEMSLGLQTLVDAPFSFRVKHTSAGLMVSGLKCGMPEMCEEIGMAAGGMFRPAKCADCVPAPKSLSTGVGGRCDAGAAVVATPVPPMPLPACPPNVERVGIDFNNPPTMTPPPCPNACESFAGSVMRFAGAGCEWRSPPPCPLPPPIHPGSCGVPASSTKTMVAEAFGQMLQEKGRCQSCVGGMTLPSPHYLQHYPQYIPAVMPSPMPCPVQPTSGIIPSVPGTPVYGSYATAPVAPPSPAPARPGLVGTWYREIGPVMCVVKVAPDHVTVTAYAVAEVNGKPVKQGAVVTADYHLTRDGSTMVGLITGLDLICEGDVPDDGDLGRLTEDLGRMQKAVVGHPFTFNVRVYGDALMIGDVKAPRLDNDPVSPGQMFAGRYKNAAERPVPQPKPIRSRERTCTPPASVGVTTPALQGDLIPPQPVPTPPAPATRYEPAPSTLTPRVIENEAPPMPQPTPPARTMEEPPAPQFEPAKPGKRLKNQQYSADPNLRMEQLLHESEDLRQIQNEWRRFWFNDGHPHLTPERVHGPIY